MTTQTGIRCRKCGEAIFSNSQHDYVACKCKRVAIDGGFAYTKINGERLDWELVTREVDLPLWPYFREEKKRRKGKQ